ncbi:hypothetical protein GJ744_006873 [Endocarpon pusillum]|uniref:Uncharacterized protein n=1 Tax=Endocarpon pusillum TaxID=364733 RepID=A0A8H7DYA5_9EURO|nr:hypothetical protein GJ744_006873 [Endocarpon pusillum]
MTLEQLSSFRYIKSDALDHYYSIFIIQTSSCLATFTIHHSPETSLQIQALILTQSHSIMRSPSYPTGTLALLTLFAVGSNALCLGSCANWGFVAMTAVTNLGTTSVTGKCGVSPAGSLPIPPPGGLTCSGGKELNTPASAQCLADCGKAYTSGMAKTPTATISGVLGGQTLTLGVYALTTPGATIGAGTTLTLNLAAGSTDTSAPSLSFRYPAHLPWAMRQVSP